MATDEHGYTQIKTRRGLWHYQKNARVRPHGYRYARLCRAPFGCILTLFLAGLMLAEATTNCTDF